MQIQNSFLPLGCEIITMKKTRLERELIQAGKELRLIEEGKLVAQPIEDVINEMRAKHGGKRDGAGRKTTARKTNYIRVTPQEKEFIQKIRETKEQFTKLNKQFIINIPTTGSGEHNMSFLL